MKIAIDLLWVKPKHNGGIESYIRNLLDGISNIEDGNEYVLFCAIDNADSFKEYLNNSKFTMEICNISAFKVSKRILWHNKNFNKILLSKGITNCFMPVYCKPILKCRKIKYVTTIHDLQQIHFPEYFTLKRRMWMKFCWNRTVKTSDVVVAISKYVEKDIRKHFGRRNSDIRTIYNPIVIDHGSVEFKELFDKYDLEKDNYYFIVSSMLKHKNVITAIKAVEKIIKNNIDLPKKLVIAGISEEDENRIVTYIKEHGMDKNCIMTGFVPNEVRNALFENSYAFLFPSVFEGFGMPVIEGMMFGARVITTKCTSIPEVSKGQAYYVNDPYDVDEWISKIKEVGKYEKKVYEFPEYEKTYVAKKYTEIFEEIFS